MQRTLGHRRTRAAALPPQPDADRHVDDLPARAAGRARLRVRRQRQAPEARRSSIRTTACRRCKIRELAGAVVVGRADRSTPSTTPIQGQALTDLRNGRVNGVLTIPPDFSRRVLAQERAARRAHRGQHRQLRLGGAGRRRVGRHGRRLQPAGRRRRGSPAQPTLDVVEVYPYVPVHPVPAAGLDRDVDLHDGDDRRRHHLHRRQGARAARGLSRHADHASSS